MCFAPSVAIAKHIIRLGADALVIEGMEAGGHIGPVSTSVLAQEILPEIRWKCRFSSQAASGAAKRSQGTWKWARRAFSSAHVSSVPGNPSPIQFQATIYPQQFARRHAIMQSTEFPVIPVRAIGNKATKTFVRFQQEVIARYHRGESIRKFSPVADRAFLGGRVQTRRD